MREGRIDVIFAAGSCMSRAKIRAVNDYSIGCNSVVLADAGKISGRCLRYVLSQRHGGCVSGVHLKDT